VPGGRVAQSANADLREFLDQIRSQPPALWRSPNGLWPRLMEGKTVTRQIVWGEDCRTVRHFDCIGFVNYCFSLALNRSVQDSIDGYNRHTRDVTDQATVLAADVLTRGTHHIGLAMGDGRVVHASQSSRGVVIDPIGQWDRRGRFIN
jgi:cell wall-associated NlpC family hydrolase